MPQNHPKAVFMPQAQSGLGAAVVKGLTHLDVQSWQRARAVHVCPTPAQRAPHTAGRSPQFALVGERMTP